MSQLNIEEIKAAVALVAQNYSAQFEWGTEDGYTWLTLYGGSITPKIYDVISQEIANKTKRNFYFNKCSSNSIEGVVDAEMPYGSCASDIPKHYSTEEDSDVEEYGELFTPE